MTSWLDRCRALYWDWRDATPRPPQRTPTVLQFPVNDICNSRCQMCHIWQQKRDHEIAPDQLAVALRDPVFQQLREVGLNGGEPTLRRDLPDLLRVLLRGLPRLRGVSLITNAIQEQNVIRMVDELARYCHDGGVHFDVMVSLDGVGPVHDAVRGVRGNFERADRVIDHLLQSPHVSSCRIGCTLIRENAYGAEHVLNYARSKPIYARFRIGIPHQRLYTGDVVEPFALNADQRYHVISFLDYLRTEYETEPGRRAFYLSLRNQLAYGAPRAAGCAWKNRGVTLTARGELAYCAVRSPILGRVEGGGSADRLFWDNADVLEGIRTNDCSSCLHDYEGLADRSLFWERQYRRFSARLPLDTSAGRFVRQGRSIASEFRARRRAHAETPADRPDTAKTAQAVLLCGWYGTETLGDKAILGGLVKTLRAAGWSGPVDLASLEPFVSRQTIREMPELQMRSVVTMAAARAGLAAGAYRLVVIAGGPLMSPVQEIHDLVGLFATAKAAGASCAILGCGIGPLGYSRARDAAIARLLRLSDATVLRDEASLRLARTRLHFEGPAAAASDPALVWTGEQMGQPQPVRDGPVLLALRDWQLHEYAGQRSAADAVTLKARFEAELVVLVDELQRLAPHWALRPFAMHTQARGGDDRFFFQRVFASRPQILAALQWRRVAPAVDFAAFRTARAVLAMRFHSVVFATAAKAPCVAIDYTNGGKTAAFLSTIPGALAPLSIAEFSGRDCARQLVAIADRPDAPMAPDVDAIYTAAWRQALTG